jgi:hypothetical protein
MAAAPPIKALRGGKAAALRGKCAMRGKIILLSFFIFIHFIHFIGGAAAIHPFYRLRSNHFIAAQQLLYRRAAALSAAQPPFYRLRSHHFIGGAAAFIGCAAAFIAAQRLIYRCSAAGISCSSPSSSAAASAGR